LFTQPLSSNGCFSGFLILAVRPYVTILSLPSAPFSLGISMNVLCKLFSAAYACWTRASRGRMYYIVKLKKEHMYYIQTKTQRFPLEKQHSSWGSGENHPHCTSVRLPNITVEWLLFMANIREVWVHISTRNYDAVKFITSKDCFQIKYINVFIMPVFNAIIHTLHSTPLHSNTGWNKSRYFCREQQICCGENS
jgi:hypothetical protein